MITDKAYFLVRTKQQLAWIIHVLFDVGICTEDVSEHPHLLSWLDGGETIRVRLEAQENGFWGIHFACTASPDHMPISLTKLRSKLEALDIYIE